MDQNTELSQDYWDNFDGGKTIELPAKTDKRTIRGIYDLQVFGWAWVQDGKDTKS